ncbi:MAG: bifunctional DNA-formamidopyrimidine glycosylase/DNA-(apurinic or apyrimidinic site) lyase [Proteobacteria bacterium]|nr:bifunctional DNA-formamidopyrimidine glycosylase/DNA-(apurinic or apyrimidinic site) lyase [Pseudomonadota bacterium]
MPELPEVEVTRRRIAPLLVGREISKVRTTRASYFFLTPPAALRRGLVGQRIVALRRQGKYLLAELQAGARLMLHLGMSGQLFTDSARSVRLLSASARSALPPERQARFEADRHTHLRLEFADGGESVLFRDVRKFGKVRLLAPGESDPRLDKLGVDALSIRGEDLYAAARGRRAAVKNLILQQSVIAGVGNIYADEGLFLAGIRPTRAARRLTRPDCRRLVEGLQRVLKRSIETGGSSISDFVSPDGGDGGYQDERRVYARAGQPCRVCAGPIRKTVVGQRGTHYCPRCQKR